MPRSRAEGGVSHANFAEDYIFADQSDHTVTIHFNFVHDSTGCKQAARGSDQPCESVWKGRLELNSSYLDASQGTELVLD